MYMQMQMQMPRYSNGVTATAVYAGRLLCVCWLVPRLMTVGNHATGLDGPRMGLMGSDGPLLPLQKFLFPGIGA